MAALSAVLSQASVVYLPGLRTKEHLPLVFAETFRLRVCKPELIAQDLIFKRKKVSCVLLKFEGLSRHRLRYTQNDFKEQHWAGLQSKLWCSVADPHRQSTTTNNCA